MKTDKDCQFIRAVATLLDDLMNMQRFFFSTTTKTSHLPIGPTMLKTLVERRHRESFDVRLAIGM